MRKPQRRQTFADIVSEVEAEPTVPTLEHGPGLQPDGQFKDQAGRMYRRVDDIDAERALALAADGATVVWDPCGCGGYCGYEWLSAEDVAAMVASGPPTIRRTKRKRGDVSEWRADDGAALLLAEDAVRWGDRLT